VTFCERRCPAREGPQPIDEPARFPSPPVRSGSIRGSGFPTSLRATTRNGHRWERRRRLQQGRRDRGRFPGVEPLIVKTADLSIVVPRGHFASAFDRAAAIAAPLGGFVSSSSDTGLEARYGGLTIRVPAEQFDAALAQLRKLGSVDTQAIRGQDVTSQFVDLNARLRTWLAQEAALIRLMAKTTTVAETLRVQAQLQRVQLTIEQLRGQIRLIGDRTANATITVRLREQEKKTGPTVSKVTNPSFVTGFKRAVAGLQTVVVAILVGMGYLLPLTALALVTWLIVRGIRRRRLATA
jgi:hypothetical protein